MLEKAYIYVQIVLQTTTLLVLRIMNILLIRYNIKSKLVIVSGHSRIYIASTEAEIINRLVSGHIHSSMLYKILGQYPINKQDY